MQLPYHNTRLKHWNPGAEMPLILPVHLICNTSDEELYNNIRENSRTHSKGWVKVEETHDGVAVLCGSGPSLADTVDEIAVLQKAGGKVFALNGAAMYLFERGVCPDYQVIIDPRKETAELVGPARQHLFASQAHPDTFGNAENVTLWHLQIGNIEQYLPDYEDDYCLIGGAASVGNTATCLAYAMGYRDLQLFGYDSSHRDGEGHAFHQKMNDGDPCALVDFNGKTYTASLTMKLQAEKFMDTSRALEDLGVNLTVHGSGLLPDMYNNRHLILPDDLESAEKAKYEAMWGIPGYRTYAPGEHHVHNAIEAFSMLPGDTVLDFGCGTGRGATLFQSLGFKVTGIDLAENSLDEGVNIPLVNACLWDLPDITADWGYCTDVMEHIPTEKVETVLNGISTRVKACYFNISTQDDAMGVLIGHKLHLTVKPADWWREMLKKYFGSVEVVDCDGEVVALCSNKGEANV